MDWNRYLRMPLEEVLKQPPQKPRFRKATLLVVEVQDQNLEDATAFLAKVVDGIFANQGIVLQIASALVVATFDESWDGEPLPDLPRCQARCEAAARTLQTVLGTNARVIYGVCEAAYGTFGSPKRSAFGPFVRGFSSLIAGLRNVSYGGAARIEELTDSAFQNSVFE